MNIRDDQKRNIKVYAIAIAIPVAVGLLSAFMTRESMDIYSELNTPPLSPPSILFPIVWTVLYVLMGISSALVWINRGKDVKTADTAIGVYALSLAFNFAWSILFFNFRAFAFSFLWLIAFLILIILTVLLYRRISGLAAYLQIPYILWVAFAGYLNLGIWVLNQ